ncbi:MAG: PH domain-containing protein [candidate division KSB1 bacterium]|nr:PH domain-containing protein [candidate division KSB1 bacterium]MDZ7311317.1 PH domain-containing protein [candidate division KSB1 bacterium]
MKYTFRPAWRSQWLLMLLAMILFAAPFAYLYETYYIEIEAMLQPHYAWLWSPFLLIFLIMAYRRYSWRFRVEGGTIESRHGLIAREIKAIPLANVQSVNVRQSFFERLWGIGDIEFSTAATPEVEVTFRRVSRPMAVRRKIQRLS